MTVSDKQKAYVRARAKNCCEYCRMAESDRLSTFHVDHVIAKKHGGTDVDDNLCLACFKCNGYKGTNVAALDPETGDASKLFHPRQQKWDAHFQLNDDASLEGLTAEGRTTIVVLRINDESRIKTRYLLMQVGDYPCDAF